MFQSIPIFNPTATMPSSHAATLVECPNGDILAAWFGGAREGHPDVAIWLARFDGRAWSAPFKVADEPGVPLWNPVLFRDAVDKLWLFYKAGPHVPSWTGRYMQSCDGGQTWTPPTVLPAGLLGPAKNKPITLSNGDILCGTSSEAWRAWSCWVEISPDAGATWEKVGPLVAPEVQDVPEDAAAEPIAEPVSATWDAETRMLIVPQHHAGIIQPTVWEFAPGRLKMLVRATQRVGAVCAATSDDYGRTWSAMTRASIPCPNSGLDAVHLADGRVLLACNPTRAGRTPLSLLLSEDNGETWPQRLDLETAPGEYSYPSVIQASDGIVHVVYTYQRKHIQHVMLDPDVI